MNDIAPNEYRRRTEDTGEIRTLFMVGIPEDCSARELRNLFRFCPGYEGCTFQSAKKRGRHLSAFVLFDSKDSALAVKTTLHGQLFDITDDHSPPMGFELAKSNLKLELANRQPDSKPQPSGMFQTSTMGNDTMVGLDSMAGWMPQQQQFNLPFGGSSLDSSLGLNPMLTQSMFGASPSSFNRLAEDRPKRARTGPEEGPLNNTLYLSNMSQSTTEEDIKATFSHLPGFVQVAFARKPGRLFAFLEFIDEPSATAVKIKFQGHKLTSNSELNGINISYSTTPIRKRPGQ